MDTFTRDDVEIIRRETGFNGFYRMDILTLRHRLFRGGWGPELRRELFVRRDAVCVLPYDPWTDSVVLLEQVRVGALDKSERPWLIELVAGLFDAGESPEEVAHREAREEADLTLLKLLPITRYYPSPGGSDERVHLYCALVDSRGIGGIHGLDSEGEDIRVSVWPRTDAIKAMENGQIDNAASIIGLQWLSMHSAHLREEAGAQP
ncbi:NUDIX domain-containing protein [Halopseudomonas salina]|uniref:ADP-ribose pyrophosphatase n=1 Tax=Halopseudomonas salina TaxID=1323744 RepID=A0ABQ1PQ83_9GAMM|nr:NUDIX domain-containing protein [Halopseudomonas salina]GGD00674.1 adenosine diphosphate sugar pyrophosphatase [Halopseudomonas salina]